MPQMSEQNQHLINTCTDAFFPARGSNPPSTHEVQIPSLVQPTEEEAVLNDMSNMSLASNRGKKKQQRQGRIDGLKSLGINVIGN